VNYTEALVWNIGTCRFDVKGEIQAENLQELNTDAKHRDGLIGSSEEAPVMGVERSDQIIRLIDLINQ
jgi:hypothetical protein